MNNELIEMLICERDRYNAAIAALEGGTVTATQSRPRVVATPRRGRPPKAAVRRTAPLEATVTETTRTTRTAAQRREQSKRMKAFWANKRRS